MSKLNRIFQKQFAGDAPTANNIAKFGSLASGNPQFTKDPKQIQDLDAFAKGWLEAVVGDKNPAAEDMNALFYLLFYQFGYLFQQGVSEWDAQTTYYKGSLICVVNNGIPLLLYSLTDNNIGNTPYSQENIGLYWSQYTNGGAGSPSSPLFSMVYLDFLLTGEAAQGWALQGAKCYKKQYVEAYEMLSEEYNAATQAQETVKGTTFSYLINPFTKRRFYSQVDYNNRFALCGDSGGYILDAGEESFTLPKNRNFFRPTDNIENIGAYQDDTMRPITGEFSGYGMVRSGTRTGAFKAGVTGVIGSSGQAPYENGIAIDSALLGDNYAGEQTQPKNKLVALYYRVGLSDNERMSDAVLQALAAAQEAELSMEAAQEAARQAQEALKQIENKANKIQNIINYTEIADMSLPGAGYEVGDELTVSLDNISINVNVNAVDISGTITDYSASNVISNTETIFDLISKNVGNNESRDILIGAFDKFLPLNYSIIKNA